MSVSLSTQPEVTVQAPPERLVVPFGHDLVEADVLRVRGTHPFLQVDVVLVSDPEAPDPEVPLEFVLHASELSPGAMERLHTSWGTRGWETRDTG
jgi:hypothetical protein